VIDLQNLRALENTDFLFRRPAVMQQLQKALTVAASLRIGSRRSAGAQGGQHGMRGGQPGCNDQRFLFVVASAYFSRRRRRRHQRHESLQRRHGMTAQQRQVFERSGESFGQSPGVPQKIFEFLKLRSVRQLAEHHQVRHGGEGAFDEFFNRVPAVVQAPGIAIDQRDRRAVHHHALETFLDIDHCVHRPPPLKQVKALRTLKARKRN
jgi:hypothetical protein